MHDHQSGTTISEPAPAGPSAYSTPVLELRNVHAGYGPIEVLHGIDLTVGAGEIVALLGPNGGGKTTILRAAAGQLPPTSGTLTYAGRDVTGLNAESAARSGLCTVPEGRGIFANLTVSENLWLATGTGVSRSRIEELSFERFPILGDRRKQLAGSLSGGEQQMLALARVLAVDPCVLLLDELSMGLAPKIVEELYALIAKLVAETGMTVLLAEQFASAVLPMVDRAAVILHGDVVLEGRADELQDQLASAYLGGTP